ncbi:MAG: hypothetical protein ACOYKC_08505 [Anaerolineaceae bacterium]|jgi:hypothetical protein
MDQKEDKSIKKTSTPYGVKFDSAATYDILIISLSLIAIFFPIINFYLHSSSYENSPSIKNLFFITQIFLTIAMYWIKDQQDHFLEEAFELKRKVELDTAFGTKFSQYGVTDYFDVEEINPGYKKLLALTHENAIFTKRNSSILKDLYRFFLVVLFIAFVALVCQGLIYSELSLSIFNIIVFTIMLERLSSIHRLEQGCKSIVDKCSSTSDNDPQFTVKVLEIFTDYNSLLSQTKVNIPSKIHKRTTKQNHEDWEEILNRYYR